MQPCHTQHMLVLLIKQHSLHKTSTSLPTTALLLCPRPPENGQADQTPAAHNFAKHITQLTCTSPLPCLCHSLHTTPAGK
jgi:hypothetical protein